VKRVEILPEGLESKNKMVALITLLDIALCIFVLAFKNMN
jgi:hypothetical protein